MRTVRNIALCTIITILHNHARYQSEIQFKLKWCNIAYKYVFCITHLKITYCRESFQVRPIKYIMYTFDP